MKVLLLQLDGKIPNLALMRIAAHHRERGDEVALRIAGNVQAIETQFWEKPDRIYASALFSKTRPVVERLLQVHQDAIVGGTGWSVETKLEHYGILTNELDYSIYTFIYPNFRQSLGFTQRGCRMTKATCPFCSVPDKEGKVRPESTIAEIWRGDPWPKEILLLDNDFFGQPQWRDRIAEIRDGGFKISFNQGINCRCLTEEAAEAIASVDYRDDSMKVKRIYTAWDNRKDEAALFAGLNRLVKHGVKPDHIMVYVLIGFWPDETHELRDDRRRKLRDFGARPYPMPYYRTPELVGFQRWVNGAYDKPSKRWPNGVPWEVWTRAKFQPGNLDKITASDCSPLFGEAQ